MSTKITEYSKVEGALAELRLQFGSLIVDCSTAAGMKEAKHARGEIRRYRTDLEKERVRIKAPALEHCRLIDSEAKRITAELLKLEEPIAQQIEAEETRIENERMARVREQQEKELFDKVLLDTIERAPMHVFTSGMQTMQKVLTELEAFPIDQFKTDEAKEKAKPLLADAIAKIKEMIENQRSLDERKAELDRIEAERKAQAAEAARKAQEEAEEAKRVERERVAREFKEREEKLRAEEAARRIEREKEEAELACKLAELREREEAIARAEKERQEREAAQKREEEERVADIRYHTLASTCPPLRVAAKNALACMVANGLADTDEAIQLSMCLETEPTATGENHVE